jgi:Periplasmic copper-binding protein (NosD)
VTARSDRRQFLKTAAGTAILGGTVLGGARAVLASTWTTTVGTAQQLYNAVSQAPADSEIYVKDGVYDITSYGVLKPRDRVKIRGGGHRLNSSGYMADASAHIISRGEKIVAGRSHGILLENLWLSGPNAVYDRQRGFVEGTGNCVNAPMNATFRYCRFSDADINGLAAVSGVVEHCEFFNCGSEAATENKYTSAAGAKTTQPYFRADHNWIHDCLKQGLWWDVQAEHFSATNNLVEDVGNYGIVAEKSRIGVFSGNVVKRTGRQAIEIGGSQDVDVYNNRFENNAKGSGILIREGFTDNSYDVRGIKIHGNEFGGQNLLIRDSASQGGSISDGGQFSGDVRIWSNTGLTQINRMS